MILIRKIVLIIMIGISISCSIPPNEDNGTKDLSLVSMNSITDANYFIAFSEEDYSPIFITSGGDLVTATFLDSKGDTIDGISLWNFNQINSNDFLIEPQNYDGYYIISPLSGTLKKINIDYIDFDHFAEFPLILRNNFLYWTDGTIIMKTDIDSGTTVNVATPASDFFYLTKDNEIYIKGKIFPSDGSLPISTGVDSSAVLFYGPDETLYAHYDAPNYVLVSISISGLTPVITEIKNENPGFSITDGYSSYRVNTPFSNYQTYKQNDSGMNGYVSVDFSSGTNPNVRYIPAGNTSDYYYLSYGIEWHRASGSTVYEARSIETLGSYVQVFDSSSYLDFSIYGPIVVYERYISRSETAWFYKSMFDTTEKVFTYQLTGIDRDFNIRIGNL